MSHISRNILLFLRGVAMGAVDLVPGVSAGTVALVTGIYPELVRSIKSFNLQAVKILKAQGLSATWQYINGNFLVILVSGIMLSLFSLATVMQFLLATYPLQLWSFFTGLIIASVVYLLRQHPIGRIGEVCLFSVGTVCAYAISVAPSMVIEGNYISMFFAGSIALCAMILPGISGSFVLLLLGLYPVFINALANTEMGLLVVFASGGVCGLMLFSRLLSWLLDHYKNSVIATMCGFLVGSLSLIWPWKHMTSSILSDSGKGAVLSSANISPLEYSAVMGQDPQIVSCSIAFLVALSMVLSLEIMAKKYQQKVR
jgi:putative membrane protein